MQAYYGLLYTGFCAYSLYNPYWQYPDYVGWHNSPREYYYKGQTAKRPAVGRQLTNDKKQTLISNRDNFASQISTPVLSLDVEYLELYSTSNMFFTWTMRRRGPDQRRKKNSLTGYEKY